MTGMKIGSKAEVKCDWCKSDNTKVVGVEYNGCAIIGCGACGHEWVWVSMVIDKSKQDQFWAGVDSIVRSFRSERRLPKRK